jgi:hypothetical protein
MVTIRPASLITLLLLVMQGFTLHAAITEQPETQGLPQPSRDQQPADVVRIVVEALAKNDEPYVNAGIATTFAFASPANKINTGPLPKFTQMILTPTYAIMLDHVEHEFSEVVMMGIQAYQMVKISTGSGDEVIFAFRLSRQRDGEFDGMWMTDAVWPVASGDIPEQAF